MNSVQILSASRIKQKLIRMAYEIWEQNSKETQITLVGIAPGGTVLSKNLARILKEISPLEVQLLSLSVDKESPLKNKALHIEPSLNKKVVLLIDDVANSGRTLLYALKPIMEYVPAKVTVVVLVDRKHKNFPITPDIIGHSVSTTLQDQILVSYEEDQITGAFLV